MRIPRWEFWRHHSLGLAAAALSGGLASLTIHPSAVLRLMSDPPPNLGWLGWVAFVPALLSFATARHSVGAALRSSVFCACWFLGTCAWLITAHPIAWLVSGLFFGILGVALGITIFRTGWAAPRWAILLWPTAWVACDALHTQFVVRFLWLFAGHSQLDADPWLAQTADLFGVWTVTWFVILANAAVALVLLRRATVANWSLAVAAERRPLLAAAGLLVAAHIYGAVRVATLTIEPGPVVALVQPNAPIDLMRSSAGSAPLIRQVARILDGVGRVANVGTSEFPAPDFMFAAADSPLIRPNLTITRRSARPVDLVVVAETGFPYGWREIEEYRRLGQLGELAVIDTEPLMKAMADLQVPVHLNSMEYDSFVNLRSLPPSEWFMNLRQQNCSLLLSPSGRVIDVYAKIELVPVGEFIPFRDWPWLGAWFREQTATMGGLLFPPDYRPGTEPRVFEIPARQRHGTWLYSSPICFESSFPGLCRSFVAAGARTLLMQSNDVWFLGSEELEQIWIGARFRAIEGRVGVARAVHNGISGVVGPDGAWRERFTATVDGREIAYGFPGALVAEVPQGSGQSLYVVVGDVLPLVAALVTLWVARPRRKRRDSAAPAANAPTVPLTGPTPAPNPVSPVNPAATARPAASPAPSSGTP